jgi:transcriptional regulator PpsR
MQSPERAFAVIEGVAAARAIGAASDLTVVLDAAGTVREVVNGLPDLPSAEFAGWVGKPLAALVAMEGRQKIAEMVAEAVAEGRSRAREITHELENGLDLPVRYTAVRSDQDGRVLALGRDLRSIGRLQQRLVEAQVQLDAEFQRARHAETRFGAAFRTVTDALVIVDAQNARVIDANPPALAALGGTAGATIGLALLSFFSAADQTALAAHFGALKAAGRADPVTVELLSTGQQVTLASQLYRQEKSIHAMVRVAAGGATPQPQAPHRNSALGDAANHLPEAIVLTDRNHVIREANEAFLILAGIGSAAELAGQSLFRWVGRAGADTGVLVSSLRDAGAVKDFVTVIRPAFGPEEEVEITAALTQSEGQVIGTFLIRRARPLSFGGGQKRELPRSVERMTELVGRVPLKDLVRDTTDVIEKLSIETALKLTGNNRASAAQMLGLSRQSLYAKLRRYDIDAPDDESEEEAES